MIRLRRITTLTVIAMAALPAAASATVICPTTQPTLNAWAGSPKTLTMAPCVGSNGPVAYTVVPPPAVPTPKGAATAPSADGTFTFTGAFNPNGSDPIGAWSVTFDVVDADLIPGVQVTVPISIGPAPEVNTTFTAVDLEPDTTLQDGRPTFDVFYKTPVTATSTLTDPTPVAPLAAFQLRFRSGLGVTKTASTNVAGKAVFTFTPLVTDEYDFAVPSLPGSFLDGFVFWVAPDWKIAKTFPVRKKKYVISGRLLANASARTKGSFIKFQRRKGTKWITVIPKVAMSTSLTFTVRVSRAAYTGKTVRFFYTSKNADYIGSSFKFTVKVKAKVHAAARSSAAASAAVTRTTHR